MAKNFSTWDELAAVLDGYGDGNTLIAMVAYLDESGASTVAETITMSGVVARANQWKKLTKKWPRVMKGFSQPYHHTDILDQRRKHQEAGDENGVREYDGLQRKIIRCLSGLEYFGFGAAVLRKDWDAVKDRCRTSEPYKDPWFFVFELAIQEIMHRTEEWNISEPISFVFDRVDKKKMERATSLYSKILELKTLPYYKRLGDMGFSSIDEPPLQAADLFVGESNLYVRDTVIKETQAKRWQWTELNSGRPPRAINGSIARPDYLEALALAIEESRLENLSQIETPPDDIK